ncbi:MAG: hypothetical protein ACFB3T_16095 [Geminicoccaceae bacterium]
MHRLVSLTAAAACTLVLALTSAHAEGLADLDLRLSVDDPIFDQSSRNLDLHRCLNGCAGQDEADEFNGKVINVGVGPLGLSLRNENNSLKTDAFLKTERWTLRGKIVQEGDWYEVDGAILTAKRRFDLLSTLGKDEVKPVGRLRLSAPQF